MTTQTFVDDKPQSQASAPHQTGVINPSRSITPEDELHLRDYTLAAQVISWDSGTFGTSLQVTAADITNIAIAGDTVWYQINLHQAIPLDIETFHAHRLRIEAHKVELEVATEESHQQPDKLAGDSVRSSLQPTLSAPTEFETGHHHGQADAAERLHPIYTKPKSESAIGYLEGYHGSSSQQQPAPTQPVEWSVDYDPKWHWYRAWVKDRCIGHGSTPEDAERIAQRYIATDEMIRRQNAAVLKAYSDF